jgi:Mlc titration factor MtfA (ptsG expression regulator)
VTRPTPAPTGRKRAFGQAFDEFDRDIRQRRKTLLALYAAEDPAEFFAVATEAFFEMPLAFRAVYPEPYRLMRDLYRLDPASWATRLKTRPSHEEPGRPDPKV